MQTVLALFLSLALIAVTGPASAAGKLDVVTTTADLKALVLAVGAGRVAVESLTSPSQDPHSAEIKPAQLARLRSAALIVRVGLDHEPWFRRLNLPAGAPVLDASRGARLLQTETPRLRVERRSHVHAFGNTHYWLDPENARPVTASIMEGLTRLSPADQASFAASRTEFLGKLDQRLAAWKAALGPYQGTKVVVIHDTWTYFADRFGLTIVAAAEPNPGVPPSSAELATLTRRMREAGVRVIIADPHSSPALVKHIAAHSGATVVTLVPSVGADPAADNYLSLFELNVSRLVAALR